MHLSLGLHRHLKRLKIKDPIKSLTSVWFKGEEQYVVKKEAGLTMPCNKKTLHLLSVAVELLHGQLVALANVA